MTDKEIKSLIEIRWKDWKYGNSVEAKYKAEECKDILELIDSMQEEPKFNIGDRIRLKGTTAKSDVITNIYKAEDGNTYFEFENSDDALADKDWELIENPICAFSTNRYTEKDRKVLCKGCEEDCEYSKKEDPVSKDFEMALAEMIDKAQKCVVEPWVVAAQWKDELVKLAKSEEPVSEDLEEASRNYADNEEYGDDVYFGINAAFKAGAKWQIARLMKDAVDVTVHIDNGNYPYIPQMELYDYDKDVPLAKEGDKYKVILIKE